MFYSETILSRRGPLGKVWLAAHMERKLSKSQTLQTDIEQSVDAIMGQEIELMALRLSGQLLLGVVRIYSRKAKYLLDDCNEALFKIKMAFRPGVVDLTEDQLTVNKTTITLQANGLGLDLLLPDIDWDMGFEDRPVQRQGHHQAHIDDITLRTADDFGNFGADDPFELGASGGIGSQDFDDIDIGINWGDEQNEEQEKSDAMSVEESVGVGRDAMINDTFDGDFMGHNGFGVDMDALSNISKSRDPSMAPMDVDNFDVDLGELGIGFDDIPQLDNQDFNARTPSQTRSVSRASSPLTEPPQTPPPNANLELDAEAAAAPATEKAKRKPKDKKQIIDEVTELQGSGKGSGQRGRPAAYANPLNPDVSAIITTQHFLPRSAVVMRLLEIRDDPVSYFLPTQSKATPHFFCAAPPGLAPELASLFMRPIPGSAAAAAAAAGASKRKGGAATPSPNKRPRLDADGDIDIDANANTTNADVDGTADVEMPRRAVSVAGSDGLFNGTFDKGIDDGFEFADQSGAGADDFQLDIPSGGLGGDLDLGLDHEHDDQFGPDARARSVASNRSRYSSMDPDAMDDARVYDGSCLIAVFDASQPSQQTQTQSQTQPETQEGEPAQDGAEPAAADKYGYSKNTVKALGLIRRELQPGVADGDVDGGVDGDAEAPGALSFKKMAARGSRRAASAFFFELLVLGTRDCVKLAQPRPFADIDIAAKPRLWEHQLHAVAGEDEGEGAGASRGTTPSVAG